MKWYEVIVDREPPLTYTVATSPGGVILKAPRRLRRFIGRNIDVLKRWLDEEGGEAIEVTEEPKEENET
jgi:hypothetical protein